MQSKQTNRIVSIMKQSSILIGQNKPKKKIKKEKCTSSFELKNNYFKQYMHNRQYTCFREGKKEKKKKRMTLTIA